MEKLSQITTLKVFGGTHEGMSGKHNEDNYGIFAWKMDENQILHLGVVADGVGGQIAGEIASRITIETVEAYFNEQDSINNVSGHLEQAILAANEAVYNASQENPEYRGMSTTIAMVAVVDNHLYTSHVGDSRIYFLRDGRLQQVSIDHTWAQEAIEAGLLTREQAKVHPNRNVIKRHLGGKLQLEVDHRLALIPGQSADEAHANQGMPLNPGDTILICSDGLTDMISDEAVLDSLTNHFNDLPTATAELIDKANQAGGRDNITVVLLQVPGKDSVPVATTLIEHAPEAAVVEPTLITAAPKTISRAKPAAATTAAAATEPVVAQPTPKKARSWKLPILILIVLGVFLLVALAVGAYFLFGDNLKPSPTPTPTATVTTIQETPLPTHTPGSPATAAILETAASSTETSQDAGSEGTVEGQPTLRATLTPSVTPTRTPIPPPPLSTATLPIPTALPSAAPTNPPQSTQGPPPATSTKKPTATQPPPATPTGDLSSRVTPTP
ncbi:MAG: protein phosphatase 2C domain-containing protein [Candidatus Promineifilaceae bacterium]